MTHATLLALDLSARELGPISLMALASAAMGLYAGRLLRRQPQPAPSLETPPDPSDEAAYEAYWAPRRASARYKVRQVKVLVRDCQPNAVPFEGWLLNRSLGGLGLSVSRALEVGAIVDVRAAGEDDITSRVRVEVRYCRLERGRWRLGCKFVDPLPSNSSLCG
jgi:hypothetical protein